MEKIRSFEQLEVWKLSHSLMIESYNFTKLLLIDEKFNRISQIKRSASSVPANIAEGFGRYHYLENIQFCRHSRGSLEELKNHFLAARDLKQASAEKCNDLIAKCDKVKIVLNCYIQKTRNLYLQNQKK